MQENFLKEFEDFLRESKRLSKKTIKLYLYWIKDLEIENLNQDYLNRYIQKKGNHFVVRGAVLSFLEMTGLNKTFELPRPPTGRKKKRLIRDISNEEFVKLRAHFYSKGIKYGLLLDIIYEGALRLVEVPTIRLKSFKWLEWLKDPTKHLKLTVIGKGNKERTVLISPETAEILFRYYVEKYNLETFEQLIDFSNSQTILFTGKKGYINENIVYKIISKESQKALGWSIRPHELRHKFATELEKKGVQIRDIKNYLGHSELSTTEIYLHKSEKESISNIENILSKPQEAGLKLPVEKEVSVKNKE